MKARLLCALRQGAMHWRQRFATALLPILLLSAALLYWSAVSPAQERLERARRQEASLHLAQVRHPVLPAQAELARFYARFRSEETFPDTLGQLVGMAEAGGLSLNEGDYKVSRDMAGKLVRYQIILPLRGEYPQVRHFLSALGQVSPALALENVQFERPRLGDAALDVKLRLVLFLERAR